MEPDPLSILFYFTQIIVNAFTAGNILGTIGIVLLLISSALVSGSEVAFFSLRPVQLAELRAEQSKKSEVILQLLSKPEKLLATILIANNFINVGIVILSSYVLNDVFDFTQAPLMGFIIQVVVITFLLLLFGEIIPKVYAAEARVKFARFTAAPFAISSKLFSPISNILLMSTDFVNKRLKKTQNISVEDLSHALELTHSDITEDKNILEGIVHFGSIEVKEIMKPRVDVSAADVHFGYNKVRAIVTESGFSRIPVYKETFDNIKGILYVKDLLKYIDEADTFPWQDFVREPFFIPENMKINGLLAEFQTKKMHMALVTDEYGGVGGIVTLEDILEEIVGEITDESDKANSYYTRISENEFLFEGKTPLNDFYKIMNEKEDVFEDIRGDADSLAGLILEIKGEIPKKNDRIKILNYKFKIESADNRKIKQIHVSVENRES